MNRIDLQQLALTRIRDAEVLLGAGQWSGAYYLAGYAVECGLKACIAKRTGLHDFPDKDRVLKSYSHNLGALLEPAALANDHKSIFDTNRLFKANWSVVRDWNETSRYTQSTESEARELHAAITQPIDGVLSWITGHW